MIQIGWNLENSYARLPKRFFVRVEPTPVSEPKLVLLNHSLAQSLGMNVQGLQSEQGIEQLSGNQIPEGAISIAQAYAGHQFGHFTMLGDGRAVLLGEQINPDGQRWDIQLKGSGRTAFSRGGDGRATLGPMLREYIMSEAMYALGIPTNRSLAVVTTGETVMRETPLPGAVLTRVAASHLRIGTFEYGANWGTLEELRVLADYAIQRHYPEIIDEEGPYLSLLQAVIQRQASLIAQWQLVGFIHGVMNTDNMTISGETIDYGPCAFMDIYDPATVFSSIDVQGRYAYQNQPSIAQWNLARFAETLLPLLDEDSDRAVEYAQNSLTWFGELYHKNWLTGMRRKLGFENEEEQDNSLIQELLRIMKEHQADFTNTFRALSLGRPADTPMHGTAEFTDWYEKWQARLARQKLSTHSAYSLMKRTNPAVIPRNHRVEEALEAAVNQGDFRLLQQLLEVLSNPYAYSPEQEEYAQLPSPSERSYVTFCGT